MLMSRYVVQCGRVRHVLLAYGALDAAARSMLIFGHLTGIQAWRAAA